MFHATIAKGDGDTPSPIRLRVLSLGAGVQSTTLAVRSGSDAEGPALRRSTRRSVLSVGARSLPSRHSPTMRGGGGVEQPD